MVDITEIQKKKIKDVWSLCKTGKAPNKEVKADLINLYNEIYKTRYRTTSNCNSCLNSVYQGIKNLVNKYDL